MRRVRLLATVFVVLAPCAALAGEAETSARPGDAFSAAFGKLADRMGVTERSRPRAAGRGATARSAVGGDGPARTEDLEAALERLKTTGRIGLRGADRLGPDEEPLGLRIPLSKMTTIVPTYDIERRDVGMAGTDGDRAHTFRIGASLRF